MAHISRFQLVDSDRDGFTRKKVSLVKDTAWKVGGDEKDVPPPSKRSLGGEGESSVGDALTANDFQIGDLATPAAYDNPINYLTAAGGITPSFVHPWMYVVGSLSNITISANPQMVVGVEGKVVTLYGVGSTVRIVHGTGLILTGSAPMVIGSGDVISFMYNTGNAAWRELSRGRGV